MGEATRDQLETKLGRLDVTIFETELGRQPDRDLAELYAERGRVWRAVAETYVEGSEGWIGSWYSACADELKARQLARGGQ